MKGPFVRKGKNVCIDPATGIQIDATFQDEKGDQIEIFDPATHSVIDKFRLGMIYNPELNQWIGPITEKMLSETGNPLVFGPAHGEVAQWVEQIVLLVGIKKLGETPQGVKMLGSIAIKYLDTIGRIIEEMSQSSSAHVVSCAINQYVACTIYQRLGLMSPHDATQTRAWLDHQIGEALLTERAGQSLGALTTLVRSTNTSKRGEGMYAESEEAGGIAALVNLAKAGK